MLRGSANRCRCRGVASVGIQEHGDLQLELGQEVLLDLLQQLLPRSDVAAADEDRCVMEVLRPAGKNRAMDQVAHLLGADATVTKQLVGAAIDGYDPVKRGWLRIRVELDQDLAF